MPAIDARPRGAQAGEFSSFEHGSSDSEDEEGQYEGARSEEAYETPSEEREEWTGSSEYERDVAMEDAPRTLSLSQMTLGKGALQSVNF